MMIDINLQHAPETRRVHSVTSRLGNKLYARYGVFTAELNAGPLLWRLTKEMGGTRKLGLIMDGQESADRDGKQQRCTGLRNGLQVCCQCR